MTDTPKKKILHVEDDILLAKMYERRLLRDGMEVTIAANGQEAIDMLHEGYRPDLILLDIMMPKMNGFQMLEKMKADMLYARIPVVVLTNLLADDDNLKKAKELGVKAYHVKSAVTVDEVAESIKKVMKDG